MFYSAFDFPLGRILLVKSDKGLSLAEYVKPGRRIDKAIESFRKNGIPLVLDENKLRQETELFSRYFRGNNEDFTSLALDFISGTPYQKRIWLETRKIPFGKTETYKSIALKLNHRGYRSVGQALSRNPLLIVIPCHRVLGSDGSLGGFSAGLKLKDFLLRLERGEISS